MFSTNNNSKSWANYYENHKLIWYDPAVSVYVKSIVRIVELHRSDSQGWSISVRKVANLLGIAPNTALNALNEALNGGFIEASRNTPRLRRKLRLSVSLRAPLEHKKSASNLYEWEIQPVAGQIPTSVSPVNTVNSNIISIYKVAEAGRKKRSKPYSGPAYEAFLKRRKELGL